MSCSGSWSDHGQSTGGFYKCNRFDSSATSPGLNQHLTAAQRAKAELDRYLHYYQVGSVDHGLYTQHAMNWYCNDICIRVLKVVLIGIIYPVVVRLQRYHSHSSALKFASTQRELAEKRMLDLQESQR